MAREIREGETALEYLGETFLRITSELGYDENRLIENAVKFFHDLGNSQPSKPIHQVTTENEGAIERDERKIDVLDGGGQKKTVLQKSIYLEMKDVAVM